MFHSSWEMQLQPRTSSGASGPSAPNWHHAHESAWARRTREERERARRLQHTRDDPLTSDLDAAAYDQPTADVDSATAKPRTTFIAAPQPLTTATARGAPRLPLGEPPPVIARRDESEASYVADADLANDAEPLPEPARQPPPEAFAALPAEPVVPPAPPIEAAVARAPASARETTTGSLLSNRYLLGRLLGAGGGALIFQAEDRRRIGAEDFGSKIAIKVLRPEMRHNSHAITRLKREFRQMQRLTHPGIARVFELTCDEDIWFMTMELVDGQTINQWLKSSTSRTAGLQIISACCDALTHAHEAGIVHGDLKPSNVLVLDGGGVKLVDFGSAAERDTATGEVDKDRSFAATPPYASPQVLAGEIADPSDDVFSLACLTYAVLTHGEHPFDRKSSAEAQQAQMKPAYSRSLLPRQFEVIVRALSWERDHRPASVREFLHALISSDLRRDSHAREHASTPVDVISKPLPSTPTRDAPTIAATKEEKVRHDSVAVTNHQSPITHEPRVPAEAAMASKTAEPTPKRESAVKQEDIARLKAAVAAAEALAERIEPPKHAQPEIAFEPLPVKDRKEPANTEASKTKDHADPLAKFRGYVAGPMAQRPEDVSDEVDPVAFDAQLQRAPDAPPKTSKRVWPWQRSAWAIAIAVLGAFIALATQLDFNPEPIPQATARPGPALPATSSPVTVAVAPSPAESLTPQVGEKKSPPVVAKPAPVVPGEISFATRTLHVGVGQTMAALSVERLNSTRGRARVSWTIEGGTAKPGVDYQVAAPRVIEFLEGQRVRSLFIPLMPDKNVGEARTSKTFTVKLQATTGGPKLGAIKQVYVTIVGDVADERVAQVDSQS